MARSADWKIKNMDTGEVLLPPYPVDENGVRISGVGGEIPTIPIWGAQDPLIQWTHGKLRAISFSTALFTEDATESIEGEFEIFTALALKDPDLGRPPICVWSLGTWIHELCLVENVDVDIPPLREDEQPRHVRLTFQLLRYRPFSQVRIDSTKPNKESYFLVATSAEQSYEAIARRYYGNPLLGDRLRKRHPEMPMQPEVGSTVHIPPREIIRREKVEPAFFALSLTNKDALANFERILKARSQKKTVLL